MREAVLDVGKAICREGIEPFEVTGRERDAMHRTARNEQRDARCKAVLLAVDGDVALSFQPEIDLCMGVAVQDEGVSRRHHGDAAHKTVCRGLRGRDQRPKPDRAARLILPPFVLQGTGIYAGGCRCGYSQREVSVGQKSGPLIAAAVRYCEVPLLCRDLHRVSGLAGACVVLPLAFPRGGQYIFAFTRTYLTSKLRGAALTVLPPLCFRRRSVEDPAKLARLKQQ